MLKYGGRLVPIILEIEEILLDTDIDVNTLVLTENETCLDFVDLLQTWVDIQDETDIPDKRVENMDHNVDPFHEPPHRPSNFLF